jgi:hypothetical protein
VVSGKQEERGIAVTVQSGALYSLRSWPCPSHRTATE